MDPPQVCWVNNVESNKVYYSKDPTATAGNSLEISGHKLERPGSVFGFDHGSTTK